MGGKFSEKQIQKRKERSRVRAAKWHAHKGAVLTAESTICRAMESFRKEPTPGTIPAEEKAFYEDTKEILASKLMRSVQNLKNSTVEEHIVERILRAAIIYDDDGYFLERYKIKWVGHADATWEPRAEFEFNEKVDEFWRMVKETPSHELNSGQVWIHEDDLSNE